MRRMTHALFCPSLQDGTLERRRVGELRIKQTLAKGSEGQAARGLAYNACTKATRKRKGFLQQVWRGKGALWVNESRDSNLNALSPLLTCISGEKLEKSKRNGQNLNCMRHYCWTKPTQPSARVSAKGSLSFYSQSWELPCR
jgi:hypothetical protein